ncbi:hypothetical protein [Collimonas sp.]|uniref:hypothetical protein n=1 Tax=Collimonas sp. TaxID=1963772 RepID=UPI002B670424|nr:hypothetical protein [Collimonas sp.]HWX01101.1 hypothetical protein [Collimonas sp.]
MSIKATVVAGVVAGTVVGVVVLVAVLQVEVVEVSPLPVPVPAGVAGLAVFAALLPSPPPQAVSVEIKATTKNDGKWLFIFMIHDRKENDFWTRARIVPDKN